MCKTRVEILKFMFKEILNRTSRMCGSSFTIFVVAWYRSFDSHHHHQVALC